MNFKDLTPEELISLLESEETPEQPIEAIKTVASTSNVFIVDFLQQYGISKGSVKVELSLLHKLYSTLTNTFITEDHFKHNIKKYLFVRGNRAFANVHIHDIYREHKEYKDSSNLNRYIHQFKVFLKRLNVKPGKDLIQPTAIQFMYDGWNYNSSKYKDDRIPYSTINQLTRIYFKTQTIKNVNFIGIDKDSLKYDLTKEKEEIIYKNFNKEKSKQKK